MGSFLEERISVKIKYGGTYADDYAVDITKTSGGTEYRRLVHPYPTRVFRVDYIPDRTSLYTEILNIYHRAYGKYSGFRAKAGDDYSTNGTITAPTSVDQTLQYVSNGVYQLIKKYGTDKTPLSIGYPTRIIYKPVAGTTLVAIGTISAPSTMWSVNTTNGQVTFTNKTAVVTAITKAASAVITVVSNTFIVGESVYITGVLGMTQINGRRGLITSMVGNAITVAIDSTAFSTYTSGGALQTSAQNGVAKSNSITAITKATSAVVTVGTHTFLVGETVTFSGVLGMTQINGLTGVITAKATTTITVAIDSTAFSTYTNGGTVATPTYTAEVVTGGCEFDIPVRFNSSPEIMQIAPNSREVSIELIEILNP